MNPSCIPVAGYPRTSPVSPFKIPYLVVPGSPPAIHKPLGSHVISDRVYQLQPCPRAVLFAFRLPETLYLVRHVVCPLYQRLSLFFFNCTHVELTAHYSSTSYLRVAQELMQNTLDCHSSTLNYLFLLLYLSPHGLLK